MVDEFSCLKFKKKNMKLLKNLAKFVHLKGHIVIHSLQSYIDKFVLVVLLITHNLDYFGLKRFDAKVTWNEK
jgi:hypothetical protein